MRADLQATSVDADRLVVQVVESSRLFQWISSLLKSMASLTQRSLAHGIACTARDYWRRLEWRARWRTVAGVLIGASITHMALNTLLGSPVGRLWLLIPGAAMITSVMLLVGSRHRGMDSSL